jgi:hypothetical protein
MNNADQCPNGTYLRLTTGATTTLGLCLRVGLMKQWLPSVRFICFIRPTRRQRPKRLAPPV